MKNKHNYLFNALLSVLAIVCLMSFLPNNAFADPGDVDVTVYHHYDGVATAVREDIQLQAGDYALSAFFALTADTATYKVYEVTGAGSGSELVTFEAGYLYTVNIYYAREINAPTYRLAYDANGGTGNVPDSSSGHIKNDIVTLAGNTGSPQLSKSGYSFDGWALTPNGVKVTEVTFEDEDIMVYARWNYDVGPDRPPKDPPPTEPQPTEPPAIPEPPLPLDEDIVPLDAWPVEYIEEAPIPDEYPPLDNLPQTGDAGLLSFYFLLLGASLIGLRVVLAYKPRRLR